MGKFEPKGDDALREDYQSIMKIEDEKEREKAFIEYGKKNEEFKGNLHSQKTKRAEYLKKHGIDPKTGEKIEKEPKKTEPKKEDVEISTEDKARFLAIHTRTELKFLKKVMKVEECDFDTAWKSKLFKSLKAENDALIKSKKSKLGPSGQSTGSRDNKPKAKTEGEKKFVDSMDRYINQGKPNK